MTKVCAHTTEQNGNLITAVVELHEFYASITDYAEIELNDVFGETALRKFPASITINEKRFGMGGVYQKAYLPGCERVGDVEKIEIHLIKEGVRIVLMFRRLRPALAGSYQFFRGEVHT